MRFTPLARISCLASLLLASASVAVAQTPSAGPEQIPAVPPATDAAAPITMPAPHAIDPVKARYTVQVMESVLERAVGYAAGRMNSRLHSVSPDMLQLTGAARARGFRLPGYGVFFDVDVPAVLRHTMGWTLRLMQQSDQNVQRALTELKQSLNAMDPKQRAQAEMALKLLETRFEPPPRPRPLGPQPSPQDPQPDQPTNAEGTAAGNNTPSPAETVSASSAPMPGLAPMTPGATAVNTTTPVASVPTESVPPPQAASSPQAPASTEQTPAPAAPTAEDLAWAQNPDLAYEMEVRDALVSAMLEYGSTLSLGPDEYLTIAARDSDNIVMPGDLSETVTVLLRIKASDLFAYKSGRLTEADARRRIEVREF